jgi:hypothetical protein
LATPVQGVLGFAVAGNADATTPSRRWRRWRLGSRNVDVVQAATDARLERGYRFGQWLGSRNVEVAVTNHPHQQPERIRLASPERFVRAGTEATLVLFEALQAESTARHHSAADRCRPRAGLRFQRTQPAQACMHLSLRKNDLTPACMLALVELKRHIFQPTSSRKAQVGFKVCGGPLRGRPSASLTIVLDSPVRRSSSRSEACVSSYFTRIRSSASS